MTSRDKKRAGQTLVPPAPPQRWWFVHWPLPTAADRRRSPHCTNRVLHCPTLTIMNSYIDLQVNWKNKRWLLHCEKMRTHSINYEMQIHLTIFQTMPRTGNTAAMRSPKPHCCTVKRILIAIGSTTSPTVCSIHSHFQIKWFYRFSWFLATSNLALYIRWTIPWWQWAANLLLGHQFHQHLLVKATHPTVHIYLGGKNGWTCYIVIYCGYLDGLLICWAW